MSTEVWMIASELAPLAKTGGLGDVLGALPHALARRGLRVRSFLPAYGKIPRAGFSPDSGNLAVPLGPARVPVRFLSRAEKSGVVTTLVVCDELFGRGEPYSAYDSDYPDNPRRFALLARAVCERARRAERAPDILHAHDWQAALVPLYARFLPKWERRPKTVFTIHNLAYQGRFGEWELDWVTLDRALREPLMRYDGIEDHGGINFLKAGIAYADKLTTVSPTYAREILSVEGGCGLHELLGKRRGELSGILNGADYEIWNPGTDPALAAPYDVDTLERKKASARKLRERLGLSPSERPIFGVVSRLAHQKGIDLVARAAPALIEQDVDLAIVGSGEGPLVSEFETLRARYPGRMGLFIGFDEYVAHLTIGGSDVVLVPSRYEPCGLTQLYAMRYGTVPLVSRTGGLMDTVVDYSAAPERATGFSFEWSGGVDALLDAASRALELLRNDAGGWRALQRRAMARNFSWGAAAEEYTRLYSELLG